MTASFRDVYVNAPDGLKLHAWDTGPIAGDRLPVVCLPGLTRTVEDFEALGLALANDTATPRRVVAIEYRGRGLSGYDPDPSKYSVPVEAGDVLTILGALGLSRVIAVGTSRGGLISMGLSATHPDLWGGVVLNDIGPALEIDGLVRIKGYVGSDRAMPASWDEAVAAAKTMFGRDFPNLTDAEWMAWARRAFRERDGRFERTYDAALAATLAAVTRDNPLPTIWELFDAMQGKPLMVVHGKLSDLLSAQGVQDMKARRPDMEIVEVADQGHAPLLADAPTIARIAAFCARCDAA